MADNFTIRDAVEDDAENIYKVHTAAIRAKCSTHYSTEDVNIWLARQDKVKYLPFIEAHDIIVAENKNGGRAILGFGHLTTKSKESDGKTLQIRGLFVDPGCGVKGVGSALVKEMERRAKDLTNADCLIVQSSLNAVEFYKKCGFVPLELTTHQMSAQSCLQCHKMMKSL